MWWCLRFLGVLMLASIIYAAGFAVAPTFYGGWMTGFIWGGALVAWSFIREGADA